MAEKAEEKKIHFWAYMDRQGRITIPKRNRKEAGIESTVEGADVEVTLVVKRIYVS